MLPLLLFCLAGCVVAQQSTSSQGSTSTSQVESEDTNGNNPYLYPVEQTYNNLLPAAQQRRPTYAAPVPRQPETYSYMPYSFNYVAQGEDGSSSRQETGDASGRVVGSYTIAVEDGRRRVVDYVADQNGFRATVDTNEPGTEAQSPADVVMYSAASGTSGRSNPAPAPAPQTPYRPTNVYRQRPTQIYTQPAVVAPVYYRGDTHAPYRHYDNHGYDRYRHNHNGHAFASYYDNNHRYYWN